MTRSDFEKLSISWGKSSLKFGIQATVESFKFKGSTFEQLRAMTLSLPHLLVLLTQVFCTCSNFLIHRYILGVIFVITIFLIVDKHKALSLAFLYRHLRNITELSLK